MGSSKVINETLGYLLCYTGKISPPLLGDLTEYPLEEVQGERIFWPGREYDSGKNCSKRMISASAAMPCPGLDPKSLLAATELSSALGFEL